MSILNIGLKSIIKPYNKLSAFCKSFTNKVYPQYEIEIIEDSEFKYHYKQYFPNFEIDFVYILERELTSNSILNAKISLSCFLKNKHSKSSIFIKFNPKELDLKIFFNELNKNPFFREFYHYQELLKNWIILDNSYILHEKTKNNKNEIISPYPLEYIKNEFKVIPALIKYNLDDLFLSLRYDLCIIISWMSDDFLSEEQLENGDYVLIDKIKLKSATKETTRLILDGRYVGKCKGNQYNYMILSTKNSDEDFYKEIVFENIKEIVIEYSISYKSYIKKINIDLVNQVSELWKVYQGLYADNEIYKSIFK